MQIPYVTNYKATLNVSYTLAKKFSVWVQNSLNGASKDAIQADIKGYILTDLGVSLVLGGFSLNVGVKNVADTFYYTYFNKESANSIAGFYLVGPGRTAFAEGRLQF